MFYSERERNTSVNFTNIDKEDFESSFGGEDVEVGRDRDNKPLYERVAIPYTIKKGETVSYPMPLADHLAYHLAQKILMRDDSETPHDKSSRKLKDTIAKILGQSKNLEAKKEEPKAEPVPTPAMTEAPTEGKQEEPAFSELKEVKKRKKLATT